MSCRSPAPARAFPPPPSPQCVTPADKDVCTRHRSVRFSSESQTSFRRGSNDTECKRETPGSISLTTLTGASVSSNPHSSFSSMSQSAPSGSITFGELSELVAPPLPSSTCRFPKLEECAHFHYERVSLGGLRVEMVRGRECDASATHCTDDATGDSQLTEGWVCLRVRSHISEEGIAEAGAALNSSWTHDATGEWNLTRNADNFRMLDNMLHRCIYDRKVSGLSDLGQELTQSVIEDRPAYESLIEDYLHHFSIIADDTINCGPILNWLQVDNRGYRLLVSNEDSSSINTPAVAAAYSVRKYISQARDEISFDVGDMISIIDMPGPQESIWWRGKRGFKVGFFPHHCVAVIGDKVPRHMTQPPPIVGSVAVAPIKPVLRKHGKLISLFRSFILSRPSRRTLKQQGILRERVFGCDLGEHLLNSSHDVPLVLMECARVIETYGAVDGIYRLSGGSGLTQRLRAAFDEGRAPDLTAAPVLQDIHAVASLLKMYFRELPNPLCTYQLYEGFVGAVQPGPEDPTRLRRMRETVVKLPPPHYRTLSYLMRHLRRVSLLGAATGMTARNMAIVWAPNLLRSPSSQHALTGVAVQAVVTEFLICYAEELFSEEQGDSAPCSLELATLRPGESRRPKSLPLHPPTKLLSLEEARQRGGLTCAPGAAAMPPPSGAIAAAANTQLRPASHKEPKYIEVGSGPNNLPQYHTVIDLPAPGTKRGLKRSPSGWRGLFSLRSKQRAGAGARRSIQHAPPDTQSFIDLQVEEPPSKDVTMTDSPLRPVKSCESLQSESEPVAPLPGVSGLTISKQHARSASCDSYFEPWQAELADMRLRLSPQERDGNIFSEEDDTTLNMPPGGAQLSLCSSPGMSDGHSVEPSPRRGLYAAPPPPPEADTVDRKRSKLEEQLNSIGYIDGTDSPVRHKPSPEKRHSDEWPARLSQADVAKRLCKDRDSPQSSTADAFHSPTSSVKLRERSSPRKTRGPSRYSGLHQPLNLPQEDAKIVTIVNQIGQPNRVTWHGAKDNHSTLIKIDWPVDPAVSMTSTLLSSPITPQTPNYDALESDSEVSERQMKVECTSCDDYKKCLKCELTDANDYENVELQFKIGMSVETFGRAKERLNLHDSLESSPVTSTNISYQNLNRLSNISTNSSNSDPPKDVPYENVLVPEKVKMKSSVMTSSHESSSGYSNASPSKPADELYECFSFSRPNYINLQSSGSSKCSSTSPLKSPLRSTISITFKSPVKSVHTDYETVETPTNFERDSVYEDIDLDKNLSIVEDASVPEVDASLPTQQACQPDSFNDDLIILESPVEQAVNEERDMSVDIYSQVKFFKKSIEEVNAMILETPEDRSEREKTTEAAHYENVEFPSNEVGTYENLPNAENETDSVAEPILEEPEQCDRRVLEEKIENITIDNKLEDKTNIETINTQRKLSLTPIEYDNGNYGKNKSMANLNVRQLANKFESPTEQKGPFSFDRPNKEVKYPTLERKKETNTLDRAKSLCEARSRKELTLKIPPPVSPKTYKLSKHSINARSLDENAFVKEFGSGRKFGERRKSFEVREIKITKFLPDLNLNTEEEDQGEFAATPTSENKISLVQPSFAKDYSSPTDTRSLINFEADKKLSRERIEKYKEERRNFLREKYSSQSFRSTSPADHLTRLKLKRQDENEKPSEEVELRNPSERLKEEELPKFERRNTVDLGQRMRFTVSRGAETSKSDARCSEPGFFGRPDAARGSDSHERKEKISPSYNIKDMAAIFEQKSQSNTG